MEQVNLGRVRGKSAFEIAVEKGFTGTEEAWLKSLTGSKIVSIEFVGQDVNGGNRYKQVFDNGTIHEFVAPCGPQGESGPQGDRGPRGEDGLANIIWEVK